MHVFELSARYAKYTSFSVGDSASKYILSVSGYSGTAGDSLPSSGHCNHAFFSTRDQDNSQQLEFQLFTDLQRWLMV